MVETIAKSNKKDVSLIDASIMIMIPTLVEIRVSPRNLSQIVGPLTVLTMYIKRKTNMIHTKCIRLSYPSDFKSFFSSLTLSRSAAFTAS